MIKINISKGFYDLKLDHVITGYLSAQRVINNPAFLAKIYKAEKFTYTKDTPAEVYAKINDIVLGKDIEINILSYWYKNSGVVAMTKGGNEIFVNLNGVNYRNKDDYFENALHEFGHNPFGYSHGSNFPNGWRARMMGDFADKRKAVPQSLARFGSEFLKEIK